MSSLNFNFWTVLSIIALISLIIFIRKMPLWGGLIAGVFIGSVIAIFGMNNGNGFQTVYILNAATLGILTGLIFHFVMRSKNKEKAKMRKPQHQAHARSHPHHHR